MEEKKAKEQVLASELAETKSKKQEYIKKGVAVAGMAAVGLSSFEMGKAQGVDEANANDDVAHVATTTHEAGTETQDVLIVDAIGNDVDVEEFDDIDDIVIAEPELSPESNQVINTQIAENTNNVSEAELVFPDSEIDDVLPDPNVEDIDDGIISDCIQDDLMA